MRVIPAEKITKAVAELCIQANLILRKDILRRLKTAYEAEINKRAKNILRAVIENAEIARKEALAICQDTGLAVVFLELGQDLNIKGGLQQAIYKGVEEGYRKGSFRESVVSHPLLRGKSFYRGAVIHMDIVRGSRLKVTVLPKGFGCENKSQLKMFKPTAHASEIKKFIVEAVKSAGPDACPPYIVGVGIGGTADYACLLAKKALFRDKAAKGMIKKLESELLKEINKLNIGPMGLGGKATALAVNIEIYPTHIAGLPVAVNISCHAFRGASKII